MAVRFLPPTPRSRRHLDQPASKRSTSGWEEVVIPYASDSDSGSVDLQLSNLDDTLKQFSILELAVHASSPDSLGPLTSQTYLSEDAIEKMIHWVQEAFRGQLKSEQEELTFLISLSTLSQALSYDETVELFIHTHIPDIVGVLYILVEEHIPWKLFSPVRQEIFVTISALSYRDVCLLFGSEDKEGLLRLIITSVITLPSVEAVPSGSYNSEDLCIQTFQQFFEMLQMLVVRDPHLENLDNIFKHLSPWLQTDKHSERMLATTCIVEVLKSLSINLSLKLPLRFHRLGHLVAVMALLCGDPVTEVAEKAAEGMHYLLRITLRLKYITHEEKNYESFRRAMKKCRKLLKYYSVKQFYKYHFQIAQVFEVFLSPNELCQFVMTVVDGLKNLRYPSTQLAAGELLITLMENVKSRFEKVPEVIGVICARLAMVSHPIVRRQIISTVGVIMCTPNYTDTVIHHLLCQPLPFDRSLTELWRNLTVNLNLTTWILSRLLRMLQKSHTKPLQEKMSYMTISATGALYEVFIGNRLRAATFRLFPQLLVSLLIQIHHCIGLTVSDVAMPSYLLSNQKMSSQFAPLRLAVQATKTLLFRTSCLQEFDAMEKNKGWALLEEEDSHLQGVALLANAVLEGNPAFANKILYLLVPLLNRGNEKHKLTAAGFFVELLQSPVATRLPCIYSVNRLTDWLHDENILFRILALKGLLHMIRHQEMREDFISLIPSILDLLSDTKEKIILLAIEILLHLVKKMDFTTLAAMMRTLLFLFRDVRSDVRLFSMTLYRASIESVKYSDKKSLENQVLGSLVPLLLYSQDENDAVAEESRRLLTVCAQFLKWRLPREVYGKDPWYTRSREVETISKFLGKKCKGKVNILTQMLIHSKNAKLPIKRAAVLFIGLFSKCMDPRELKIEDVDWIEYDLRELLTHPEPSLCIIASDALFQFQELDPRRSPRAEDGRSLKDPRAAVCRYFRRRGRAGSSREAEDSFEAARGGRRPLAGAVPPRFSRAFRAGAGG
ncbi:protein MROH8 [Sorex araneus]|uniref:protein MROH8 n=1 Tax=Sorex araneus TaxID=42254 RepID=UPI00243390B0|nr:protein MROH8 [Sorex araneus]